MNGNFWVIQGFSIQVNNNTQITGVIPTVGAFAAAEGIVQPNAVWLATQIRVSEHDDFTPTPLGTSTPTPFGT